jgi:hypothetical protein
MGTVFSLSVDAKKVVKRLFQKGASAFGDATRAYARKTRLAQPPRRAPISVKRMVL